MADVIIKNGILKAGINLHGAELVSLKTVNNGHEYLWCGDKAYWNRVSPVLFPFVGKLYQGTYRFQGKEYSGIPQHGFARDCEFTLIENKGDEAWFSLKSDEQSKKLYPFDFEFQIGYRLSERTVQVLWRVKNAGTGTMYFSLGAHPAFLCPVSGNVNESKEGYFLDFHTADEYLSSGVITENGLLSETTRREKLQDGMLPLTEELFDLDALIIDSDEIHTISMVTPQGRVYVRVHFNTPQVGIWSPAGKKAPFVCIEPWYGRCDREGFTGDLSEREYGNALPEGETLEGGYEIEIV